VSLDLESCVVFFINIDMYLGADVSHLNPGVAKPSVTGLTRYAALTEIQQPQVEIIQSLQKMMEHRGDLPNWRLFIEGTFGLINTLANVSNFFSLFYVAAIRSQDYHWGLSEPCDVHRCGQAVSVSFYWSIDTDDYGVLFISQ